VALGIKSEENAMKMENKQLVSPSRQCSNTPAVLFTDVLTKNTVTALELPPNSSYLAPVDFYLFPLLKSAFQR
jgi:hypothetical protein